MIFNLIYYLKINLLVNYYMNHFIEKNILIDELLELEISYVHEILDIFNELRNTNDYKKDIVLLDETIHIIDNIIWENYEYLKSIEGDKLNFQYDYIIDRLNDLYIGKHKIQTFINKLNDIDIISDLLKEFDINNK
jgi:hypothetical protein